MEAVVPYVHVTLAEGRTKEQKRALMAAVAQAVHEALDTPLESVRVWITDMSRVNFPEQMRRKAMRSRCRGSMFAWILKMNPEKGPSSGTKDEG